MESACPRPYQALFRCLRRANFIESGGPVNLTPVHARVDMLFQRCRLKPSYYTRLKDLWIALREARILQEEQGGASAESLVAFPDIDTQVWDQGTSDRLIRELASNKDLWLSKFSSVPLLLCANSSPESGAGFSLLLPMVLTVAKCVKDERLRQGLVDYVRGHMAGVLQGCQAVYAAFSPDHKVAKEALEVIGILEGVRLRDNYVEKIRLLIRQDQFQVMMKSPVAGSQCG